MLIGLIIKYIKVIYLQELDFFGSKRTTLNYIFINVYGVHDCAKILSETKPYRNKCQSMLYFIETCLRNSPRNITKYTKNIQSMGRGFRKLKRGKRHTGAPSKYL